MIKTFGVDICEHLMFSENLPDKDHISGNDLHPKVPPPMPLAVPRPFIISFREQLKKIPLFRLTETNKHWNVSQKTILKIHKKTSNMVQIYNFESENDIVTNLESENNNINSKVQEAVSHIITSYCDYCFKSQHIKNVQNVINQTFNVLSEYFISGDGNDIFLKNPNANIEEIETECRKKLMKESKMKDNSKLLNFIKTFITSNYVVQSKGRQSSISLTMNDI